MKKRDLYLAAALVISLAIAPSAFGWGWGGKCGPGPGYALTAEGVMLTPAQQKNINALQQQFLQETAPLANQLQQKHLALQGRMLEQKPDSDAVMALQKELSDVQAQLDARRLHYQLASRALLTAEQIAQLPPGCAPGFGSRWCGRGPGKGAGMGTGYGRGMCYGPGPGYGRGYGAGFGCSW